jgi:deoxyribodipyrimidine photo-lyase
LKIINITDNLDECLNSEFAGLHSGGGRSKIRGGQSAADKALSSLDIAGYAKKRSQVLPVDTRGASVLSPYIRHNLLTLQQVWDHVAKAPYDDREKFRDELLWQEYARHLYARVGTTLFANLRFDQNWNTTGDGWPEGMACVEGTVAELERDGWLVNQTRMWLASHWTVRNNAGWLHGQERMYRELIDGSRAANLLGWQWTVGSGSGKPYGFARWQVEKRAPEYCGRCPLNKNCPIEKFPDEVELHELDVNPLLNRDPHPSATAGPSEAIHNHTPTSVLLTIDSLGDSDPALMAHPDLPVHFVFNEAALRKLQLSSKRIYFYLETLSDLATRRDVSVFIGDPYTFASENDVALTYSPVPSFAKFTNLAEIHPYPWLRTPHAHSVRSFSAWRNKLSK